MAVKKVLVNYDGEISQLSDGDTIDLSLEGNTDQYVRGDGSLTSFPPIPPGTVTSLGITVPTGLDVTNSPITESGNIDITYADGYLGYTHQDAQQIDDLGYRVSVIETKEVVPTFRQFDEPQITGSIRNLIGADAQSFNEFRGRNAIISASGEPGPFGGVAYFVEAADEEIRSEIDYGYNIEPFKSINEYGTSIYVKAGSYTYARLSASTAGAGYNQFGLTINLSDGTYDPWVGHQVEYAKFNVEPVGNGWYRISAALSFDYNLTCFSLFLTSHVGAGASDPSLPENRPEEGQGIYVWGPQFEEGAQVTPYQVVRSPTDFDGSGLPVGSIWYKTDTSDQVIETLRYNGSSWDSVDVSTDLDIGSHSTTSISITSSTGDNVVIPSATTSLAGLLGAADKEKLDGIESNATEGASWDTNLEDIPNNIVAWADIIPTSKFNTPTGNTDQYVRGDGTLANFPEIPNANDFVNVTGEQANIQGDKTWAGIHAFMDDVYVDGNVDVNGSMSAFLIADQRGDVRKISGRVSNASTTLSANDLNASVEKSTAGGFTYTIPEDLGEHRDAITIVNSSLSGNLTLQRGTGNVELWQDGVEDDIVVTPGSMITIFRSAISNRWIA